ARCNALTTHRRFSHARGLDGRRHFAFPLNSPYVRCARRVSRMQPSDCITARRFLQCLPSRFLAASRLAISAACFAALLIAPTAAYARVTEIVVDDSQPLVIGTPPVEVPGYRQISGRAFGELDPSDPLNAIIQDIDLGKDPD